MWCGLGAGWGGLSIGETTGEVATGGTGESWTVARETVGFGVNWETCLCVCVYVCVWLKQSVPATGVELWPWGLICPGASNWGDWDPGTATGADWASEPSCWRGPNCTHLYVCSHWQTSTCSAREGSRMRSLVLCMFVRMLCVSLHMCGQPCV